MGFLRSVFVGSKTMSMLAIAFIVGSVGWAALSGLIAGLLDTVGIHLPGSTLIAASPLFGIAAVGYTMTEVL
jgi:hypothetical protein